MMRWLCLGIGSMLWLGVAGAQSVDIALDVQDQRFPPVGVVHATCKQSVQFSITTSEPLSELSLIVGYSPQAINVIGRDRNQFATSQTLIADGRLTYQVTVPVSSGKTILSSLSFESVSGARSVIFQIQTGSYVMTVKQTKKMLTPKTVSFDVASVPECNPDITPPRIQLVTPSSISERIIPGMPLQFRIVDAGKGVDWSRVFVEMGGFRYTNKTQGTVVSGEVITITPRGGLPYNTGVMIRIAASDLQVYGGSNNAVEQYSLKTAVEPAQCRMMGCNLGNTGAAQTVVAQDIVRRELSAEQCRQIAPYMIQAQMISGLIRQIGCDPTMMTGSVSGFDSQDSQSLLLMLGWGLFGCSMLLAILYSRDHHKLQKRQREVLFR